MTSQMQPARAEPAVELSTDARAGDTYRLGHRWLIKGPMDVVFDVISDVRKQPTWWSVIKSVQSDATEFGVGAHARLLIRGQLPYTITWDVTVAEIDRPRFLETDTTLSLNGRFPMRGPVRYTLTEVPDGVEVVNEVIISSARRLPRALYALTQRAFTYNHAWSAKRGGPGLQRAVDAIIAARAVSASVA
jgi:hypothetical protein